MKIEFHRFEGLHNEEYWKSHEENVVIQRVTCSFKTDRFGIIQVVGKNKEKNVESAIEDIDMNIFTKKNEPDINVLRESEKAYIAKYMKSVLLLIFYPHKLAN